MVACSIGSSLMMQNENEWKILDIVCATKFEPKNDWMPYEFKKLKWWRKPWMDGIVIGKFYRG